MNFAFEQTEAHAGEREQLLAGVELGGTKCICTLASSTGDILVQRTIDTTNPDETLNTIAATLDSWWQSHGFAAIGIASFGPVDLDPGSPTFGFILTTNKPGWSMTDVGIRLSRAFPVPMAFDTDVNGAAMAEMRWGSGRGLADFAYVTVGTGVGVGLIVHGKPSRGIAHSEMGHIRVPRVIGDDAPSGCRFHTDCVEGLASGPGIEAALRSVHISDIGPDHPVWKRVAQALTCLCHALVVTTGPARIAIGGGVIARQPHLFGMLEPMLRASINGYMQLPDHAIVIAPELGTQAGPLGPIALAAGGADQASSA